MMTSLKFDLFALAKPKGREGAIALAREIKAELQIISDHIDAAIARCEKAEAVTP